MKNNNSLRLDKLLSKQLNVSRTDVKKMLRSKTVNVNGKPCSDAGLIVNPECDTVTYLGVPVEYKENIYIMQNKPQGTVSASDSPGDVTVIDILPENLKRKNLFPAGRLDKDTTGFVLITDDGEFAHDILSPSHHVPKTYTVTVQREVTPAEFKLFAQGITAGEDTFKPAKLIKKENSPDNVYEITITEGRYHQIKRMFASTGNSVTALHRDKIGSLALDLSLKPGESREITPEELLLIKK